MNSQPAISIIIPIYNVGSWIRRAVKTLQEQTFTDYELWLVDDGSKDDSPAICDELAAQDDRIRVIHRKNGGAASARNEALAQANGKYIYFMDGDDWCEPTMLADLYAVAEDNNLELVVTGFYIDTYYGEDKFYREQRNAPTCVYASQQDFRENAYKLFDAQLLYAPWNKLYLHKYLKDNGIVFPATFWDDLPFNLDVIRNVERVGCIDGHYYHFLRARAESENTKYRPDMYAKREEEHVWMTTLFKDWGIDSDAVQEFLARRYAERLIGCIENVTNRNCKMSRREKMDEIERMINTPQAWEALAKAEAKTKLLETMFGPVRSGNVALTYAEGALISFVRQHSTNLFARLKANR